MTTAAIRVPALALLLTLFPLRGAGAAETCPDVPDSDAGARRAHAKEQFAKAEEAEAAGDRQTAVKRYACSLKLVPHPSTAYNLGTTAEKGGDLSMAVEAFKMYLTLAPDASDRPAVEERIARLEAKLVDVRAQLPLEPTQPTLPPPGPALPPPPILPPGPPQGGDHARARGHRVAGLITLGGAAAALGTGIAFNLVARAKMRDCFSLFPTDEPRALDQCDAAKPFAYGSYGLFALSGALGVTSLTLLLWRTEGDTAVSLIPTPGGGALLATRRF